MWLSTGTWMKKFHCRRLFFYWLSIIIALFVVFSYTATSYHDDGAKYAEVEYRRTEDPACMRLHI